MKKFKYLHKESQQFKLKKDYGLQSNLGQQLEQKVKNYTILLRRRNKKIKKKDSEENKNNDLNFSFNSSSSEDYSNDYYEKFLLQLNDLKQSHNTVNFEKINPLKKSKEAYYKNNKRVHSDKLNNYLKEKTIIKEILYNNKEPKNSNNNLLSLKSDKSILKEEKTINILKNKQKSVNYLSNIKQNNNHNNNNQKEKVNNFTSISKELKTYINEEPYSELKIDNVISPINNPVKDDSNIIQSNIDENINKTKNYSSVKKTPFKKNENALSYSIKKININNNQKVKRQTSLKNENLKEKDKKSLIRKITNSLETNVNNNQNKNLFNPKKIKVENLLKKKNKKVKKENNKLKDNVIIEIPTPSLKNEIKIIEKKKKLFCCLPLC